MVICADYTLTKEFSSAGSDVRVWLSEPSCQCRMFVAYCQVLDLDQILGRAGQM